MRFLVYAIIIFLFGFCPIPSEPQPMPPPAPGPIGDPDLEFELKWEINKTRQDYGLPMVPTKSALDCAALLHARDMSQNKFCGHIGSDNSKFFERSKMCGIESSAEILGCGHRTAEDLVKDWLKYKSHSIYLLHPDNIAMGAARVDNYWVVLFLRAQKN